MTNPSEIELRLFENRARIVFFPDKKESGRLSPRLVDIAEALEVSNLSEENLIKALQEKGIHRVLDVGIGNGTDTPLTELARLNVNGEWMFPSQSLVGIDYANVPMGFEGLYTFKSVNILDYTSEELFDIIFAKGVLSSDWDVDESLKWRHEKRPPGVFNAILRMLSANNNAVIILDRYVWDEYILITDEQAHQHGFEVVESASRLFHDEQLQKKFESSGLTGKIYSKLVLRRAIDSA